MSLECPRCRYNWNFRGRAKRVQCPKCGKFFKNPALLQESCVIRDEIMQGNILDALEKSDVNPSNNKELFKDVIPLILKDEKLKFAFANACLELRKSPEKMIRKAVKYFLEEHGYL